MLPLKASDREQWLVDGQEAIAQGYEFTVGQTRERGRHFAFIGYVGDDVVLQPYEDSRVQVNGFWVPGGIKVRLDNGDWVVFHGPDYREMFVYRAGGTAGVLSTSRMINGVYGRLYHPAAPPLAKALTDGIQNVITRQQSSKDDIKFDVVLTLEQGLQEGVQGMLDQYVLGLDSGKAGRRRPRWLPAAVTLMDAPSGEILALASYPLQHQIDAMRELNPAETAEPKERERRVRLRRRLAQNWNLVVHPIGSVAKPFLAAAVWDRYPRLRHLRVKPEPDGEISGTLGIEFSKSMEARQYGGLLGKLKADGYTARHPDGFWVDAKAFLKYSSNLYPLNLLLLSFAMEDNRLKTVPGKKLSRVNSAIGLTPVTLQPDYSTYRNPSGMWSKLHEHPLAGKMAELYDVEIFGRGSANPLENTAARYDAGALSPLLNQLKLDPDRDYAQLLPLVATFQEKVNLHFEQLQQVRSNLVSFVLGSDTSLWNNVKAAESFARLITGKRVRANLINSVRRDDEPDLRAAEAVNSPLPIRKETAALLREGLSMTVEPRGTAYKLGEAVGKVNAGLKGRGLVVRAYAKTGTPASVYGKPAGRGGKQPNAGMVVFYLELVRTNSGKALGAVSGAIYIDGRGSSALAVKLAAELAPMISVYLQKHVSQ